MKASDLIITAKNAGMGKYGKIRYNNNYPYNVMYYHFNDNSWTSDCLGFVHCLINNFSGDTSINPGGGAIMDDFVNYSDERTTIYKYCRNVTGDFTYVLPGEILYMNGHVGLYIGDCEPFNDGRIFNVAECCYSSFGGGGMLTYVDENGIRYNHKNGSTAGAWLSHGQCIRVEYDITDPDIPEKDLLPQELLTVVNEAFAGKYGNNPQRKETLTDLYGYDNYRKVQDILNILYK